MATPITTLAAVKDWLGIPAADTSADVTLTRMVTAFSSAIANYLNRDLGTQTYVDTLNGAGGAFMLPANYPITAVSSLYIDDVQIPAQVGRGNNGYVFSGVRIFLVGYTFNRGFQNVDLSYTAGFAAIPADVEQACIEWIADRWTAKQRIGVMSRSINGQSTTYDPKDIPDAVVRELNSYRKVVPT